MAESFCESCRGETKINFQKNNEENDSINLLKQSPIAVYEKNSLKEGEGTMIYKNNISNFEAAKNLELNCTPSFKTKSEKLDEKM